MESGRYSGFFRQTGNGNRCAFAGEQDSRRPADS